MNFQRLWKSHGRAFLIALLLVYLPHAWVIIILGEDFTGGNFAIFLTAPGVFIESVLWSFFQQSGPNFVILSGAIFTAILIAVLTVIGARGKPWQIAAIVLGGGYSIVTAAAIYGWSALGSI